MNYIDLAVFLAFTVGVVLFGCSFFRRQTTADDFVSAGRTLPGWLVGMSIFATYVSSISYIGYPMLSVQSIIDAWWTLSSIFSGGMLGLFLLGFVVRRASSGAALAGVVCGVLVIAWISLASVLGLPGIHLHEYLAIVLGTAAIFVVGFPLTWVAGKR